MSPAETRLYPASHAGLISVSGADATEFLQAQLSRRVDVLTPEVSAIAGWHDARGKVRAVFRVLVTSNGYLLIGPAPLREELLGALRMFVLRMRVTLEAAPLVCGGFLGPRGGAPLPGSGSLPSLPAERDAVVTAGALTAVCVTPGCWYLIGPAESLEHPAGADPAAVEAAEIRAGLPQVDARTARRYVPQMLNLDRLGALDFDKGCYPGQEVIARTQHLGSVKRRACGFTCAGAAADSDAPVFDDRGERVGEVLRAARDAGGDTVLLAVVALDALTRALFLGSAQGPPLARFALPFE